MTIAAALLPEFDQEMAVTRRVLERVPDVLNPTIHHRGQLTVDRRLLDVPAPSTHGPSADDPGGM